MKMETAAACISSSPKPPTAAGMPGRPPTRTKSIFLHNWHIKSGQGRGLQRATDTLCLRDPTAFNSYTVPCAAFLPDTHSSCSRSHDSQLLMSSGLFLATQRPVIQEKDTTPRITEDITTHALIHSFRPRVAAGPIRSSLGFGSSAGAGGKGPHPDAYLCSPAAGPCQGARRPARPAPAPAVGQGIAGGPPRGTHVVEDGERLAAGRGAAVG